MQSANSTQTPQEIRATKINLTAFECEESQIMKELLIPAITLIVTSCLITACGSGGNSTTNTDAAVASTSVITDNISSSSVMSSSMAISSEPAGRSIKTGDLIADKNFDFATQKNVHVTVQSSDTSIQNTRYQLNFYTDYQTDNDVYLPHFKTQFASGVLLKGKFTQTIPLPNNTHVILAELWPYDGSAPIQALLSIEEGKATWEL